MDGIWDPPYYQAIEDTISFCLPYRDPVTELIDVIEETDINAKCCIQVLEMLLSKADTDIVEHEEELMDLLSQLACTDQVFSDMFSMSLRAKIDFLDSSIRKLKDDDENFLSTSMEPAESIYDILKSLFCLYLQKKDLQFADNTGTASSSCSQAPTDNQKKQIGTGSSTNANQMEKIKTVKIIPMEKETISPAIVKVEEENSNDAHKSPVSKYVPRSLCLGSTKKTDREVSKFQTKNILQNRTPGCDSICTKPSLKTQGKRKHQPNVIKSQRWQDEQGQVTEISVVLSHEGASILYEFADNAATASSSFCQVPADNQKKRTGSSSNANLIKKIITVDIISVEKQTISPTIVKVEQENTNYSHASPVIKYSPQSLCSGSTKKADRKVSKFQGKIPIIMTKDIVENRTPRCNSICSHPSLETQRKWKHQLSVIKSEPYDESMSLATVPYVQSSEEANAMSLVTVPYVQSSEEANALSLATVPYVELNEEANSKQIVIKEPDFPPGFPDPLHPEQGLSHSRSPYSTRTYTRRKTPSQKSSNSPCSALVVANPLDRAESYSNLYAEGYYTVNDLKVIAKQQNLRGFSKLRKAELAQALGIKLIEGRRKQPKKNETQLVPMMKPEVTVFF